MRNFNDDFTDFDRNFERHFHNIGKTAKTVKRFAWLFITLQVLLYLAIAGGVVYLIVYAITHWLRW